MKKLLLLVPAFLAFSNSSAQETASSTRQNDIMISPIELIAGPALNISYERLINKDMGIGVNGVFLFSADDEQNDLASQISPYYRLYFGQKYASGFFVEAFVPITTSNDYKSSTVNTQNGNYQFNYTYEKKTTLGAGIGFGGKWVARRNVVFEASAGIARRFGDGNYNDVTGKGMLGIGYRF